MCKPRKILAIVPILSLSFMTLFCQTSNVNYLDNSAGVTASSDNILNPERGFYRQYSVYTANSNGWTPVMEALNATTLQNEKTTNNITLILRLYYMPAFQTSSITSDFLNLISQDAAALRTAGMKAIVRFAYSHSETHGNSEDASYTQVLTHISELASTLQANADVIAVFQTGFIGGYGEWAFAAPSFYTGMPYGSATRDITKFKGVTDALLAAIPVDRMTQVRTPGFKIDMYSTGTGAANALQLANAYNGSTIARLGHHNDCFVSSPDDYGTYQDAVNEYPYLAQDTRFLPMGGETCFEHATNGNREACASLSGGQADTEMDMFHFSYLNQGYYGPTLTSWQSQNASPMVYGTCYEDVERRLGYRFELQSGTYTNTTVEQGCSFNVSINLINKGWAAPFNPRDVELILVNTGDASDYYVAQLSNQDPRFWFKESELASYTINEEVGIPSSMAAGTYNLFLHLPDAESTLYGNPDFSIQLGNTNVWNASTGYNDLKQVITVSSSSCGNPYMGSQSFSRNDVSLLSIINPTVPNCAGLTQTPSIQVQNLGTETVTSMTINWSINSSSQSPVNWTGSLAANATTNINLSNTTFSDGDILEVSIQSPNGKTDVNPSNDSKSVTVYESYNGTYSVGSEFTNIADAVSKINTRGICGPTIVQIPDGTYNEQISFTNISGASSSNTLTLKSTSGVAANCKISYSANSSSSKHTVKFENASNIIIENLSIEATGTTYGWPLHLNGENTSNVQVNNCVISTDNSATSSNHIGVVINGSNSSYSTGANVNNCTISNNQITGGRMGITAYGLIWSNTATGNTFSGNTINSFDEYGMRIANQNKITVQGNIIVARGSNNDSKGIEGVDIHTVTDPPIFDKNQIYNVGYRGINFINCYGGSGNNGSMNNNMIGGGFVSSNTTRGIFFQNCNNWNLFHNSINLDHDAGASTTACPIYVDSNTSFDIKNNNLAHTANSGSGMAIRVPTGVSIDYNNYYNAASSNLVRVGNTIYTTSDFTTGGGVNSINQDPNFISTNDLHLTGSSTLKNVGTNVGISDDIDGDARPLESGFDIGADEAVVSLPIELLSFSGNRIEEEVQLNWEVDLNSLIDYFEVEKSENGIHFNSIGKVQFETKKSNYTFIDANGYGKYYYRLKLLGFNQDERFSQIILIENKGLENIFEVFPNPFSSQIVIVSKGEKVESREGFLEIRDIKGSLVFRKELIVEKGSQVISLSHFEAGVYFFTLHTKGQYFKQKIIKIAD